MLSYLLGKDEEAGDAQPGEQKAHAVQSSKARMKHASSKSWLGKLRHRGTISRKEILELKHGKLEECRRCQELDQVEQYTPRIATQSDAQAWTPDSKSEQPSLTPTAATTTKNATMTETNSTKQSVQLNDGMVASAAPVKPPMVRVTISWDGRPQVVHVTAVPQAGEASAAAAAAAVSTVRALGEHHRPPSLYLRDCLLAVPRVASILLAEKPQETQKPPALVLPVPVLGPGSLSRSRTSVTVSPLNHNNAVLVARTPLRPYHTSYSGIGSIGTDGQRSPNTDFVAPFPRPASLNGGKDSRLDHGSFAASPYSPSTLGKQGGSQTLLPKLWGYESAAISVADTTSVRSIDLQAENSTGSNTTRTRPFLYRQNCYLTLSSAIRDSSSGAGSAA